MKKKVIGYIYNARRFGVEEKKFFKVAKKMGIQIVPFNLSDKLNEEEIEKKARNCDIIFNDTSEFIAEEMTKTLEELGNNVVENSKVFRFAEDKWIFFLKCLKHNIPTPKTILLSDDLINIKNELIEFNQWPVVLKRVQGCKGEFVEKADNPFDAIKIIKHFWEKGNERLPIIAQEFVLSDSYRVTLVGDKIVQTVLKKRHGWKSTGVYSKRFAKFEVDPFLEKMVKKVAKVTQIKICGIDLAKKDNSWIVIEANAEPAFDFFNNQQEVLIADVLNLLLKT